MNSKAAVVNDAVYVILGGGGNTGSIIANSLLSKGEKVRVLGRDAGRLQRYVRKGGEAFTADVSDAAALIKAFGGARAAYLMLPPLNSRDEQERQSDAIAKAAKESGLRYAVHLSSYGAHVPEGTGPVTGLHSSEQKLNAISDLNVLHLRAAYFMENNLTAIDMIRGMGMFGHALIPDLNPIGRDAIMQWPGGVNTQLYWHTTAPSYAPLQPVPENRVYVSPDRADAFVRSFVAFSHGTVVSDEPRAPGIEIGRPADTYPRVRIESKFGKLTVLVTDGHLPYPYGREMTGYDVTNLTDTLTKAKAAGVDHTTVNGGGSCCSGRSN